MKKEIRVWNTKTKTYENRKVKLKGALITGNILDIIEIILILVIVMGLLSICGLSLTDLFGVVGNSLSSIWNWFIGF